MLVFCLEPILNANESDFRSKSSFVSHHMDEKYENVLIKF